MSTSFPLKKINVLITLLIFLEGFCYLEAAMSANMPINRDDDYTYFLQMAQKNRSQGNYETALLYFDKAIEMIKGKDIANKLFEREAIMEAIESKALVLWNLGQMKEAAECFSEGLLLAQQWKMSLPMKFFETCLKIYELYQEGKNKREKMDFVGAISDFEKAIYMARKLRCPELELKCLRQASLVFFDQNELEQFHLLNERGLRIARLLSHKLEEGRFLNNIALYQLKLGEFVNALSNFNEALLIAENKNAKTVIAECLNNIGLAFIAIGFFDRAIHYFEEALRLDIETNDMTGIILDNNNIGLSLSKKGKLYKRDIFLKEAIEYFEKSLSLAEKIGWIQGEVIVLNNMSNTLYALGETEKAIKNLKKALKLCKQTNSLYDIIRVSDSIANIYIENDPQNALRYFLNILSNISNLNDVEAEWTIYFNIGRCYETLGQYLSAIEYYNRAMSLIEKTRRKIFDDFYSVNFIRNKSDLYDSIIRVKLKLYKNFKLDEDKKKDLFYTIENIKKGSFTNSLIMLKNEMSESEYYKNKGNEFNKIKKFELKGDNFDFIKKRRHIFDIFN
ncbi:MAG: tetratricopeptide repeat protein [Candidatus Methanomethylicaceae archaeon]